MLVCSTSAVKLPASLYLIEGPQSVKAPTRPFGCSQILTPENSLAFVLQVRNLSGGELQRVAITLALGTPADIYLIDEPSAYLDSEQRIIAAKVHAAGRLV